MAERVICHHCNISIKDMENGINKGFSNFNEFKKKSHSEIGCIHCDKKSKKIFDKMLFRYRDPLFNKMVVL